MSITYRKVSEVFVVVESVTNDKLIGHLKANIWTQNTWSFTLTQSM